MTEERHELETPEAFDLLYEARGAEVSEYRPVMTGDVFAEVDLPLEQPWSGLVAVVTHPCSMRRDGVNLMPRLHVAPLASTEKPRSDWANGPVAQLPLPQLRPEQQEHLALQFDEVERVPSQSLRPEARLACLSSYGVELLQQRYTHYLTRVVVPTFEMHAFTKPLFDEAELLDEWLEAAIAVGSPPHRAALEFHELMRTPRPEGSTLQALLRDDQQTAYVRRAVRRAAATRYGGEPS